MAGIRFNMEEHTTLSHALGLYLRSLNLPEGERPHPISGMTDAERESEAERALALHNRAYQSFVREWEKTAGIRLN